MMPKLNSTVSVVKINDIILEFFKSNTRQQVRIKVDDDSIMKIVCGLDGLKTIEEIAGENDVSVDELKLLLNFLRSKGILDNVSPKNDFDEYDKFRRVIHFLEDFSGSHEHLLRLWGNIQSAQVMIVGLGAVGSWVTANLAQSGVLNFILLDPDTVEMSNLHRQFGYVESDIGRRKVDALADRLQDYNHDIKVTKVCEMLDANILKEFDDEHINLIINCADQPNVDTTSLWIGEYSMRRGIPHIVGGGYNLHLSLIGQSVIPGSSACVKCFQNQLEEENKIDTQRVRKLAVRNRKVGSFGPMCSIIASMVGMEAIKILSKEITPANLNRRGEFDIYSMDVTYKTFVRREDCEWCGKEGQYYH